MAHKSALCSPSLPAANFASGRDGKCFCGETNSHLRSLAQMKSEFIGLFCSFGANDHLSAYWLFYNLTRPLAPWGC